MPNSISRSLIGGIVPENRQKQAETGAIALSKFPQREQIKSEAPGLYLRGKTYWLAATMEAWGRVRTSLNTKDLDEAINLARHVRAYPERYFAMKDSL